MFALAALAFAASSGVVYAQPAEPEAPVTRAVAEGDLPDGWAVLDRAVEASGGVDAFMKIKNFVAKGSFSMPAMGIEGTIVRTEAAPDKLHMRIELGPMGQVVQATNGEVAWMVQPGMQEAVILEGDQADEMIANARFYDRVQPREEFESAELVGTEDVDGTACYRVNLKSKSGQNTVAFYSVDAGHQVRTMSRSNPDAESFDVVIELSDYREVGPLVHPFVMQQKVQGNEFTITFESFEHDVAFDDSIFTAPTPEVPEGEI